MSNSDIVNIVHNRVAAFISAHGLFSACGKYIVALSGGADSVALLRIMCSLGYNVEAAHCNFHLRGDESGRDEAFCVELCERMGICIHRIHFDTREYASLHKVSIEMAARDLRYRYFEQLRADIGADAICVAHHQDDNVETILLNIIRGTGVSGLTGMSPRNGDVIRPLLCVGRKDIMEYLGGLNQDFVTDSSNLVDDVQRNKLRLNVIPLLEEVNPAVKSNILNMSRWVGEASAIVGCSLSEIKKKVIKFGGFVEIDIPALEAFPSPEYLLWDILKDYGFNSSQVIGISANLHLETGKTWLSATHELVINRNKLLLTPIDEISCLSKKIPEVGTYVFGRSVKLRIEKTVITDGYTISRQSEKVCLDASKVRFPLVVRNVVSGDRFVPYGMKGTKLVNDFLSDQKVPLPLKRRQLVVTDADGNIVWVVGRRPDGRFCLSKSSVAAIEISLLF